jgi:putative acetyltransferase
MAADVRIRPFRDADCTGLADLWVGAWQDVVPDIDFDARRPWFLERIAGLVRGGAHVEVAEDGAGRLLGVVTVDPRHGHLDQLAVTRDAWGSGVAAALVARARALSPAGLDLEVNTVNVRAIRFYEREGFRRTGEGLSAASGLPLFTYAWRPHAAE